MFQTRPPSAVSRPGSMPFARISGTTPGEARKATKAAVCRAVAAGGEAGCVDDHVLQFARQRTDEFGAVNRKDRHNLLHADLGFAGCDQLGHRPTGQFRFRLHFRSNSKALQQLGNIGAARTVAIGDRASCQERVPEGRDRADIGLSAHRRVSPGRRPSGSRR